jgi:diguanylate cyclase (GGDEF)-like protein/PAS domain S-box-containing protein
MNKETIFIVDDNREIANFWARKLLPSLGFDTLVAHDGKTALKMLKTNPVSLLMVDYELPDMTGLDILKQIYQNGQTIPSILITAHGSEQVVVDAFHLGAQDYLTKPVNEEQLKFTIDRVLSESRLRREKAILTTQLNEHLAQLNVLAKVGKSVTASLDLDNVLKRIVEASVLLTRAEEGFLALLDEESQQLYLRAAKNIDEQIIKTMRIPVEDNLVGEVLRTRQPVRTTSESENDQPIKVITGFLVRSLLHVPLILKNKAIGVLTVVNLSNQRPFKERDENLLASLADYATIAIENANLYTKSQQELEQRIRMQEALRVSEERYALAVNGANDGIWDWDIKTNDLYTSSRWKKMLGLEDDDIGNSPQEWFNRIHPQDLDRFKIDLAAHLDRTTLNFENEHRLLHKDGSYRWILSRGLAVWDENGIALRMAGSQSDITDRKYAEEKLLHDAFYDKLTGLPNRALFMDHLNLAVERAKRRQDYHFAVLFLDLDRFKDINDIHGHLHGDELLIAVARLFRQRIRSTDTVARFGGDEFVILLEDINDLENSTQVAGWILQELNLPFIIDAREMYISASIGIVMGSTGYTNAEDVVRDADIAMYHAKAKGKSRYEIFYPAMRTRIMERLEIETELRQAIDRHELKLHYQIIASIVTGQIIGFEALVRWEHPKRGLLPPKDFIPVAEETGLIIPLDRYVLREACQQLNQWQTETPALLPLSVSVNISGTHVSQSDLFEYVKSTLEETGLKPENLKLEITESVLMENLESTERVLRQLQELGVQIQIDDFGIGYSSLGYLSNFPIDALKIDHSFIKQLNSEGNDLKIVQAILMLSHRLGVGVIAEGIETEQQLMQLRQLGCELGQGFYVAMPLNSIDLKNTLVDTKTGTTNLFLSRLKHIPD